jgi:eukaryotic-like serine/threonine-protein kinase
MGFHIGQRVGDYSIAAFVGAGGMGRVYKMEHALTKHTAAMKVLDADLATEAQIKRFEREMRSLAKLTHPNIAALHKAIHTENQLMLLMEFVEGRTLESLFGAGRLARDTGIGYVKQMLSALGYAHRQGVVHRDVTPSNVIVTAEGQIKLTDFGLAKCYGYSLLTNCGEILGSLPYLPPEQLKGTTQPDKRSDLYSVGAILYEHLTGKKPFGTDRGLAAALADLEGEPQPPSQVEPGLSPEWDKILRRALARDPARRYHSAGEFLDAIGQLEQRPVADPPPSHSRALGIGIAACAGLVVAVAAWPAVNRLSHLRPRKATPAVAPRQGLHIAPPDFATAIAPPREQRAAVAKPRNGKHAATQAVASALMGPAAASLQEAPEPVAAALEVESDGTLDSASAKRGFWSKLNVFHKRTNGLAADQRR